MNNFHKPKSLEEKLITSAPFSMSNGQNYINKKFENSTMRQEKKTTHKLSRSWLWKTAAGLVMFLGLGLGNNKVEAQGMFDNTSKEIKELISSQAHVAAFKKEKKTADYAKIVNYSQYDLPGAIANSKDEFFKRYWVSEEENMSRSEINKNLENISNETKSSNPYYFLAIIKNGGEISKKQKHEIGLTNTGLREHIVGTEFYYKKDWKQARLHYAMGMFKSAQIDKSDLDYLNIQNNLSPIQLYKAIADKFIDANYEKKEEIIQKVILDDNNDSDKLKMIYDNLGGFLISTYKIDGNSVKNITENFKEKNTENSYQVLLNKYDYNSASTGTY